MKNIDRKLNYSVNKMKWKKMFSVLLVAVCFCLLGNMLFSREVRNQVYLRVILLKSIINFQLIKLSDRLLMIKKNLNGSCLSELENLQKENLRLKSRLSEIAFLKNENEELRTILNMNLSTKDYAVARVIYKNSPEWFSSITIDIGSDNDVKLNDVVFNEEGLIGKIVRVFPNKSIVLLSTDINFNVPVYFEDMANDKDSKMALIRGNNNGRLTIIVKHSLFKVFPEQKLYTTGDGGIFPEGLYVGKTNFNNEILPAYDIQKIKYVCVKINKFDFLKFIPKIKIDDKIFIKFLDKKFIEKYQIGTFDNDERF